MNRTLVHAKFIWSTINTLLLFGCASLAGCGRSDSPTETSVKSEPREPLQSQARFALLPSERVRGSENPELSDAEILALYRKYMGLLEPTKGLEKYAGKDDPCVVCRKYDRSRGLKLAHVWGTVIMKMRVSDGMLIFLANQAECSAHLANPVPQGALPARTKEDVLAIAEKYKNLLFSALPPGVALAEPKVEEPWNRDFRPENRGVWIVRWHRIRNGYQYRSDRVSVGINDKFGLSYIGCNLESETCATDVKISEEDAKAIAWLAVPVVLEKWPWIGEDKYDRVSKCELVIVNPNYRLDPNVHEADANEDVHEARLAYEIWFHSGAHNSDLLNIDVDAGSGEVLGCSVRAP